MPPIFENGIPGWVARLYRWRVNHDDAVSLMEIAVAFAVFLGLGIAIAPVITPALLKATDTVCDFLFYHLFCMD